MSDILRNPSHFESAPDHEFDAPVVLSFEEYREFCDEVDGFRKVGIQDEESYEAILQDERTIFTDYEGQRIPLIAPLQYEKMYDEERCLIMSGKKNAMLLAIPIMKLETMQLDNLYDIDEDTLVIVEEFVPTDESVSLDEHDMSLLPFMNAKPFNFINPELTQYPNHETAWMASYRFEALPEGGSSRPYEGGPIADDFMKAWRDICAEKGQSVLPDDDPAGTFLLSAEQLAERPDIVEQLWDISQIGFGKILGAHHPISMEFNKQFFDKQIVADNTVTAVHYVDGQIACFGFLGLDLQNNEWLNNESSVLQQEARKAEMNNSTLLHFHELVGRGQRGMGYAKNILNTMFDVTAKAGYPTTVFFESTNLSSLYIPSLITREMSKSETINMTSDIDILGKLSYWALVADKGDDVDSPRAA